MNVQKWIATNRHNGTLLRRVVALMLKFIIEGVTFLFLSSFAGTFVFILVKYTKVTIPPQVTYLPSTIVGFTFMLALAIGKADWCFLDTTDNGLGG